MITKNVSFGPYREDTPVIWDWGAHDLSVLLSLMGKSPNTISCKKLKENKKRSADESIWNIKCNFDDQIKSSTLIGNMMTKSRKVGVLGSNGMLVFDDLAVDPLLFYRKWFLHEFPNEGGEIIKMRSKISLDVSPYTTLGPPRDRDLSGVQTGFQAVNSGLPVRLPPF